MGNPARINVVIGFDGGPEGAAKILKWIDMANGKKLQGDEEGDYSLDVTEIESDWIELEVEGGRWQHLIWQLETIKKRLSTMPNVKPFEYSENSIWTSGGGA